MVPFLGHPVDVAEFNICSACVVRAKKEDRKMQDQINTKAGIRVNKNKPNRDTCLSPKKKQKYISIPYACNFDLNKTQEVEMIEKKGRCTGLKCMKIFAPPGKFSADAQAYNFVNKSCT